MKRLLCLFAFVVSAGAQVVTFNDGTIIRQTPYKIGVNIGAMSFYGSGQITKNLLGEDNAGFEPLLTQQVWTATAAGTTTTFTVPDIYPVVPVNRFTGATYLVAESATAAKNCAGTISSSTAGAYPNAVIYTLGTPCAAAVSVGDTLLVKLREFPTTEAVWEAGQNDIWASVVTGGGKLTTDSSTPYDGLQSLVLDTSAGGSAAVTVGLAFDSQLVDRFVNLNGTYSMSVAAKILSGTPGLTFQATRSGGVSCSFTATPTTSWAVYTGSCTAAETSTVGPQTAWVYVSATGTGKLDIDDVSFTKTSGQNGANTSVFRDEVVATLGAYCGGTTGAVKCPIRDWLNQNGETLDNWIATAFGSMQSNAGDGAGTGSQSTPRLQDFLKLVSIVNGVPYLEVPVTFSATDAANLIEFLESTNTATGYGQKRAALGQSLPWVGPTGVFAEIYMSFCNECWNGGTPGQDMPYRASATDYYTDYAQRMGTVYAAMRASPSFLASATHLGFDMQLGVSYGLANDITGMAARSGAPDFVEQAPYTQSNVSNWQTDAGLWASAFEEPWGNATDSASSSGYFQAVAVILGVNKCGQSGTATCFATDYEQANSTLATCGVTGNPACSGGANQAIDQAHTDYITAGAGEGVIAPLQALLMAQQQGIAMQNYFGLTEYSNATLSGSTATTAKLWGLTVDIGGAESALDGAAYRARPQMLGLMAANAAMIGPMFSCPITSGATYNWAGDTVNGPTHALSAVPYLNAVCFESGTLRSMVVFNSDLVNSYALSFSGANSPTGTVSITSYAPAALDTLNEASTAAGSTANTAAALVNTFSTVTNPASYTLPAHSETVLSWTAGGAPVVTLSGQFWNF